MADNRKIVNGVRLEGRTITDVDELAQVLTPEMHERLSKSGAIQGDWAAGAEPKETTKTTKATKKE